MTDNVAERTRAQPKEGLRVFLVDATGCNIQGPGKGWPCGTCFMGLLDRLGLSPNAAEYHERNDPPDRHNEVWRAILQTRGAK